MMMMKSIIKRPVLIDKYHKHAIYKIYLNLKRKLLLIKKMGKKILIFNKSKLIIKQKKRK